MTTTNTMLFLEDAYTKTHAATVTGMNDRGGILLDKTIFYANSGGQPGDTGTLTANGTAIAIATTVYDENRNVVHVPTEPVNLSQGDEVELNLNWEQRHAHMRVHTCLHLLCSLIPFPVTGGQINPEGGRLDFDIPEAVLDKMALSEQLNALIQANHSVTTQWIDEAELDANPEMVRTMAVKPPRGEGRIRLVLIGGGDVDRQPCGGTHVKTTGEIGPVYVSKIEKKGRQNRRVRVVLGAST